jgi:hypothetical protein
MAARAKKTNARGEESPDAELLGGEVAVLAPVADVAVPEVDEPTWESAFSLSQTLVKLTDLK